MRFLDSSVGAVKSAPRPVTSDSVLYRDDYIKEINYKFDVMRFGSISRHFMNTQITNHINVLHEIALKDNERLEHAGSMGMYNLLLAKYNGRLIL